jgi:hypothetical protein
MSAPGGEGDAEHAGPWPRILLTIGALAGAAPAHGRVGSTRGWIRKAV